MVVYEQPLNMGDELIAKRWSTINYMNMEEWNKLLTMNPIITKFACVKVTKKELEYALDLDGLSRMNYIKDLSNLLIDGNSFYINYN